FVDELYEDVCKLRIVVLRVRPDNLDCLAVAVCSWLLVSACLVHHAEAIPAVMDVRKAVQEFASGGLGLIQLSGFEEGDGGVGGGGQLFEFLINCRGFGNPRKELRFRQALLQTTGFGVLLAGGTINTTLASLSRPQGLPCGCRGVDLDLAARRQR